MRFKRLAAAVMAAVEEVITNQRIIMRISQPLLRYGVRQRIRQKKMANGFRQCASSSIQNILNGI